MTESEQGERRGHKDRRRGSAIAAVAAIVVGAGVLAAAAAFVPLAAGISTVVVGLVWWSLLRHKPHVRRTELLASGGGSAVVLWTILFVLAHVFGVFPSAPSGPPAIDAAGEPLEIALDLQPKVKETDGLEWLDNMVGAGMLATLALCLAGWGWRTLRRRRGRRRSRRGGQDGGTLATTGEHTPVTPVTPVNALERFSAGAARAQGGEEGR